MEGAKWAMLHVRQVHVAFTPLDPPLLPSPQYCPLHPSPSPLGGNPGERARVFTRYCGGISRIFSRNRAIYCENTAEYRVVTER